METTGPEWDGDGKGLEMRLEPLPVVRFSLLILLYSVLNDYLDYVFETKKATKNGYLTTSHNHDDNTSVTTNGCSTVETRKFF